MKNILIIGAVIFGIFFLNQRGKTVDYSADANKIKADLAHNLAFSNGKPVITPDVVPDLPDDKIPALADCPICHGTRIQIHGDGHKTPCPYHGSQADIDALEEPRVEIPKIERKDIKPKVQTQVITKATNCPCGCRHQVANCTCRASCPGKQLPAYTYHTVKKPVIQNQVTVQKSYSSSGGRWVCNGRSCTWVPNTPLKPMDQIDQDTRVYQQTQPIIQSYSYSDNRFGQGRFGIGKGRVRGLLGKLCFWR